MTTPRSPRIKDVAERAGVSTATVSLVINDKPNSGIPEATRERVIAAVEELGYRRNAMARGLRRQRSDIIGLISDNIATTPYAGAMLRGAQEAAWDAGYMLMLIDTEARPDIESRAIETLLEHQVDGIVYATMYHQVIDPPPALGGMPTVLLDARSADADVASVAPDEIGGAYAAIARLATSGHRRIGFLQNVDDIPATHERLEGYVNALADHELAYDETLVALARPTPMSDESSDRDHLIDDAATAAMSLLERADRPTALFCFNDRMAMGAYRAARRLGLRIPQDLSVIGFDNQELIAASIDPPLTTVQLPHYDMGCWAVEQLIERLGDDSRPARQHRMPCHLVERASVAPPGEGTGRKDSTASAAQ